MKTILLCVVVLASSSATNTPIANNNNSSAAFVIDNYTTQEEHKQCKPSPTSQQIESISINQASAIRACQYDIMSQKLNTK